VIRVVLVDEQTGWVSFCYTDPSATVDDILTTLVDRLSLETSFRDCKEIVGAGEQQEVHVGERLCVPRVAVDVHAVRGVGRAPRGEALVDQSASQWDDPGCRPRHAVKRRAWRLALLREEIRAVLRPGVTEAEINAVAERLLNLTA
jgi:hypothetical protein